MGGGGGGEIEIALSASPAETEPLLCVTKLSRLARLTQWRSFFAKGQALSSVR